MPARLTPNPPGPLLLSAVLTVPALYVIDSDTDPINTPIVTRTLLLPPRPLAGMHATLDSDTHAVDMHALLPTLVMEEITN